MGTKAELQEQLEVIGAQLAAANAEIEELKTELRRRVRSEKEKAQKQSNQLEEERKKLYDEAKDTYTQSIQTAKDIYCNYKKEVAANLGIVAIQVREEIMHTLETVFGDELD